MNDLMDTIPRKVCHTLLCTIFYFDVEPSTLTSLAVGTEFTTVYSPWPNREWRAAQFRVVEPRERSFQEIETWFLNSDEVTYFEGLLKATG